VVPLAARPVSADGGAERCRLRLLLWGRVQGVGFRPWLYRLARDRGLQGTIINSDRGVVAELEGPRPHLEDLRRAVPVTLPPHAELDGATEEWLPPSGMQGLQILASADGGGRGARIPADLASCSHCLREVLDPGDRRHGYPFTNCTGCGPRFTIVEAIPYDRCQTSMRAFALCARCAAEYADPLDRRYHAEPTACPACGPRLRLVDAAGAPLAADPMAGAVERLRAGQVIAVKGLGGFHLAVDPRSGVAVERLRQRKGREQKPLAVMVRDLEEARRHAIVSAAEEELLRSSPAPIVLLRRRPDSALHPAVAPDNPYLGLMLPYTPLHHLLLVGLPALVMTSGNLSEEPIAIDNTEARARLHRLADAFLEHDRAILVACDDSVAAVAGGEPLLLRRSRGHVPDPVRLQRDVGQVLATGGQLKNTFCLTLGADAYLGPHVGDLESLESYEHYQRALAHMQRLLRIRPTAVVHDLHPDYATTRFAGELGLPALGVQHHHAHVAATAIDHDLRGPLLGLALDGTGYSSDGTIWGGELLLLPDLGRFTRLGHLRTLALPGGDASIRSPRRIALALLLEHLGVEMAERAAPRLGASGEELGAITAMIARDVGVVRTSSCGRLFDAVGALCGLGRRVTYDGQTAMELEFLAAEGDHGRYRLELLAGTPLVLDPTPALTAILADLEAGTARPVIAARFHDGLGEALAGMCARAARETGVRQLAVGGGCFQNRRLLAALRPALERAGLALYLPRRVPANDGGLALGQAAVYAAVATARCTPCA
jgi:hydrogenase maturation protein HypF